WVQLGGTPPPDSPPPLYNQGALVLTTGAGIAYYVQIPTGGRLTGDVDGATCEVTVSARAHGRQPVEGVLRGARGSADLRRRPRRRRAAPRRGPPQERRAHRRRPRAHRRQAQEAEEHRLLDHGLLARRPRQAVLPERAPRGPQLGEAGQGLDDLPQHLRAGQ